MNFDDLAKQPGAELVEPAATGAGEAGGAGEAEGLRFDDLAKMPGAEVVDPANEAPSALKTGLSHLVDAATLGSAHKMAQSQSLGDILRGRDPNARIKAVDNTLTNKDSPWAAAAGDLSGFLLSPAAAVLPGVLGAGQKLAGGLGKILAGAGFGGLVSGGQTLNATGDIGQAGEAAGKGLLWGGAATAAPLLTGAGLVAHGLQSHDPQEKAQGVLGGLALAIPGALSHTELPGKLLEKPGASARGSILQDLIKEFLPTATDEVAARNTAGETQAKNIFREAQRARSPLSRAPAAESDNLLADDTAAVKARNAAGAAQIKDYAARLRRSTSTIGSGPGAETPSIPGQPNLEAQALGKLGTEVDAAGRAVEQQQRLGFELTDAAKAGRDAAMPDLYAKYNSNLERLAPGKAARLQALLEEFRNQREGPAPGSTAPSAATHMGFFPRPDLLPTTGTLKPNPLAGFKPEPLPAVHGPERATLPRDLGLERGFAGIKANPTAGFTPEPLPTEESIASQLQPQVQSRLDAMRQEQGLGSRFLGGAAKGMLHGAGGNLSAGSVLMGKPKLAAGGAAVGGLRALAQDPVLATSILEPAGRALRANAQLSKRVSGFLAGATGPLLTAKLKFLMDHDKEFKAAVADHGP